MKIPVFTISLFILGSVSVFGQTTALTYQGRLTDSSLAATGTYQMMFSLFNDPLGGTPEGSPIELTNVQVTNGVFTVQLDFGSNPFPFGENRYLQIEVRRNSGESYTPLTPRQQVTTSPYSIRSLVSNISENASQLGGVAANQYVLSNDARLSDARPPTAGSGFYVQNTTTQQTGNFNISATGRANIFNAVTQFNLNNSRFLSAPGTNNTFLGIGTGTDLTTGFGNTFIGRDSGGNTTTGNRNTFVGSGSGFEHISGSDNSFFGFNAGLRVTTGVQNSLFGVSAGSGNLVGIENSFFGYEAGLLATGSENAFFGRYAGRNTTAGLRNSFFGRNAGENNNSGSSNTFVGESAGRDNTTGGENSFVGRVTGVNNETGSTNSFFGSRAGFNNLSGSGNSFFGYGTGLTNSTGTFNTIIGTSADLATNNLTYATALGAGSVAGSSNSITLGRANRADTVSIPGDVGAGGSRGIDWQFGNDRVQIGACNSPGIPGIRMSISSTLDICDAGGLVAFGPHVSLFAAGTGEARVGSGIRVTSDGYVYAARASGGTSQVCVGLVPIPGGSLSVLAFCSSSRRYKSNIVDFKGGRSILDRLRPVAFDWRSDGKHDLGLVAEEVAEVEPLLASYNEAGEVEGVKYDRIGVVLINVVKEQQAQIESQSAENKALKTTVKILTDKLDDQQRQLEALRLLVCSDRPDAKICAREPEKQGNE